MLQTLLMINAITLGAVALLPLDAPRETRRRPLLRAWLAPLPLFVLWLTLIGSEHGWRGAHALGALVWLTGWLLLHPLASQACRVAHGLVPIWVLLGAGIALQFDLGAFSRTDWGLRQTLGALTALLCVTGALALAQRSLRAFARWWRASGVRCALWLWLAGIACTGLCIVIPKLRYQNPAWYLEVLSFTIGVTIVGARIAGSPAVPVTWRDRLTHWKPALLVSALPAFACVVPQFTGSLTGGTADLAPAAAMSLALGATFWFLRARHMAIALAIGAFLLALLVTSSLFPIQRPAERLNDWRYPERASSNQGLEALQSEARAALIGRVGGWITTRGVNAANLNAMPGAAPRALSAVPLATTDGIYAGLSETTGFIGFFAMLVAGAAVLSWLLRESLLATDLRARAWFTAVATLFATSTIATAGWPCGALPIAGLPAPALCGGFSVAALWSMLFALSAAWSHVEERGAARRDFLHRETLPVGERRFLVPDEWHESAARRSAIWPFGAMTGVALLWILGCALWNGVLAREQTLALAYMGLSEEKQARTAILNEWVVVRDNRLTVHEALVRSDFEQTGRGPLARRRRAAERRIALLRRWISEKRFVARGEWPDVTPRAFVENESSGLGALLHLSHNAKREATN